MAKKLIAMNKYAKPGRLEKVKQACLSGESIGMLYLESVLATGGVSTPSAGRHSAAIVVPIPAHTEINTHFICHFSEASIVP